MTRLASVLSCVALAFALPACGGHNGNGDDAGGDGRGTGIDANGTGGPDANGTGGPDAPPGAGACSSTQPQCNNCIDDDGDNLIDGADPECTGAIDNDEASFGTGIPGDNIDPKNQDCFFDGNSGAGNDGCNVKTCCILGYTQQQCANAGLGNNFNPATDCPPPSQFCIDHCQPLTPPGCDCFGCCTICDPTNPSTCADVFTNPALYPSFCTDGTDPTNPACCTATNLSACLTCTPTTSCGSTCNQTDPCNPCPGQPPPPPSCIGDGGAGSCPNNEASCNDTTACPDPMHQYCSSGCCIGIVG